MSVPGTAALLNSQTSMASPFDDKAPLDAPPPYSADESTLIPLKDVSSFENEAWTIAITQFSEKSGHKEARLQRFLKDYKSEQTVQKICEDKKRNGSEQYGKVMSKILDKIGMFTTAGNIAVKAAPESVGLAWMGISVVLGAVQDDYQTLQVIGAACADIVGIMITSRLLTRMFKEPRGPAYLREIQDKVLDEAPNLYGKIIELFVPSMEARGRESWKRKPSSPAIESRGQVPYQQFLNGTDAPPGTKDDLAEIKNTLEQSAAVSSEMAKQLEEARKEMEHLKKRTPLDVARETFDRQRKQLDCRIDQATLQHMQDKRLQLRKPGTCSWIFDAAETPEYTDWIQSNDSELLLILGGANMGKSVLVSTVIERLQGDADAVTVIFFCRKGEDNAQKTDLIFQNILHALYAHAANTTIDVLDKCNEAVRGYLANPVASKDGKRPEKGKDEDRGTSFEDAFRNISTNLDKKVYLVVDALDECTDRQQRGFINKLRTLSRAELNSANETKQSYNRLAQNTGTRTAKPAIKILASGRPEVDICESIQSERSRRIGEINIKKHNDQDISEVVNAELASIPDLSTAERKKAHDTIVKKAASTIGYVNSAIATFKKPWQRPLIDHLNKLPDDLLDMNASIFTRIDPSYVGLLKTCLTWTLLASGDQKIKVEEVADAYSRVYTEADSAWERQTMSTDTVEFYKNQLVHAGYDFLDVNTLAREISLIKPAIVKDSFLRETAGDPAPSTDISCETCRAKAAAGKRLTLTEREGHSEIARTIFQHLNSPLFQRLYVPALPSEFGVDARPDDDSGGEAIGAPGDGESTASDGHLASRPQPPQSQEGSSEATDNAISASSNNELDLPASSEAQAASNTTVPDTEPPSEGQDVSSNQLHGLDDGLEVSGSPENDDVVSDADSDFQESGPVRFEDDATAPETVIPRYEISNCVYHLRQVERLWNGSDKPGDWDELWESAIRFFESPAFRRTLRANQLPYFSFWSNLDDLTPLLFVTSAGLAELTRRLLAKNADVRAKNTEGRQALHFAAGLQDEQEQLKICTMLLERSADPNNDKEEPVCFESPFLFMLYCSPSVKTARLFLDYKADPQEQDDWGWSSLHNVALSGNDPDLVRFLIEKEADINAEDQSGETPLHKLVRRDDCTVEMLKAFLEARAEVNKDNKISRQRLAEVSQTCNLEIVKSLLDHGADVHDTDDLGTAALHRAALWSNWEVVDLLLSRGGNAALADKAGRTCFWRAAGGDNIDVLRRLTEALRPESVEVLDKPDDRGRTPLRKACAHGNTDAARFLLDLQGTDGVSTDVNAQDLLLGRTALHAAAYQGFAEIVALLLSRQADAKSTDNHGKTPLQLAYQMWSKLHEKHPSNNRYETAILQLVDADRDAAVADIELLHVAAIKESIPVLDALLHAEPDKSRADPNARDEHGWTAVDLARQYGRSDAERLLHSRDGVFGQPPSRWLPHKRNKMLVSEDGTEVWQAPGVVRLDRWERFHKLFSEHSLPSGSRKYYYEIELKSVSDLPAIENPEIAFGVAHYGFTKYPRRPWLPGQPTRSTTDNMWDYHGDDGWCAASLDPEARTVHLDKYGPGDTLGCAVDFTTSKLFFTKNGTALTQHSFSGVKGRLHCAIGMSDSVKVKTNFTGPFRWAPGDDKENWKGFEGYPDDSTTDSSKIEAQKAN
ncbi:MAG: hypothetical protein Q9165_006212 [Trypethelium subeluteriae]